MKKQFLAAIDIGNTRAKIGIFSEGQLLKVYHQLVNEEIPSLLKSHQVDRVIVSSVNKADEQQKIISMLQVFAPLYFSFQVKLPVDLKYDTPQTLGVDRIAAAVGASFLYPAQNVLSIDCGSCITYDILQDGKYYLGGAISPGVGMKLKALNTFTARLPLVESRQKAALLGKSTEQSIISGVVNGSVAEMEGMIAHYQAMFSNLKIVLCGGDALFFDSKIKGANFVVEDLVLIGLHQVLLNNV
jgi:type III pantothenate kinase